MADELDPQKTGEVASQQTETEKAAQEEAAKVAEEKAAAEEATKTAAGEGVEPGGADGQAVYQRKLYRENKQLHDRLRQQEIDQARLTERLKITEETLTKQPTQAPPKLFTVAELEAALNDPVRYPDLTRADVERYKFEVLVPRQVQAQTEAKDRERSERDARERPLNEARKNLGEYTRLYPWLNDPTVKRTQEISAEYSRLVRDRGLPQNEITTELAISQVLGPIDKATQRRAVDDMTSRNTGTYAESGAGGANNAGQVINISKAPQTMQTYWNKVGLTEAQRKTEWKIYQELKAQGK